MLEYTGAVVPFHFIVSFDPQPTNAAAFREELLRVAETSRREAGCVRMDVFESVRHPYKFAIHSEWIDEAAFELHASLPHTAWFLSAAEKLVGRPIEGLRLREIDCGTGASLP